MNVATIVPQNYLHLTSNDNYFMCLANLIGAPGMEEYTEFFEKRSHEGKYVIMDNGLIEGDPRPISELITKASLIGAKEMILPDVFCDKEKTLKAIDDALTEIDACHRVNNRTDWPRLMLVPQGNSVEEWVSCAHQLICKYNFNFVIGVPKVLVKLGGRDGRIDAIDALMQKCPIAKHKTFHLLGCWNTPLEVTMIDKLVRQGVFPNVRGVDSALPFIYARAGKLLTHQDRPDSFPINFRESKINSWLLMYNIYQWRRSADATRRFL